MSPEADRFITHVDRRGPDECWPWLISHTTQGYARFCVKRDGQWVSVQGSRFAYELWVGPIPEGLFIDHLCRNRGCVNPAHMEPVTNHENVLRGVVSRGLDTFCSKGHPLDDANTGTANSPKGKRCLMCHREAERRRRAARGIPAQPGKWLPLSVRGRTGEGRRSKAHASRYGLARPLEGWRAA